MKFIKKSFFQQRSKKAFSLVELLVVLAIIGVLSSLSVIGFQKLTKNSQFKFVGRTIADQLTLGRQTALTKNCEVEVQILSYKDPEKGNREAYRAIRLFIVGEKEKTPLGKMTSLPEKVIFSENAELSPLLTSEEIRSEETEVRGLQNVNCRLFRFHANGATDLPVGANVKWHLTAIYEADAEKEPQQLKYFYTFSIDPIAGTVRVYGGE
ncbi:MAG: Verru_Chthon cassette protein D [Verrucomicrobiota bacterium]